MSDIASLGIKVESNLKSLNKDMEKTISLSEKVTDATNKINESFKSNVVEASKIIEAEKKKASAIDKMISSIKMQNISLVEGKSGLADYKLSILGASESQKKFAQDIIASMESVRSARKSESEQVKSNLSSFKSALSEQAKVSQMAQDAEKSRLSSINSIIDSLSREEKSLSMTKQEQTKYNLALLGASDAEKKSAQDIQNRINAIKDSEKAQKQAAAQEKEAAKIASNLAKEQAQAQKQIADAETKRKDSINGIILKLRDEAATVGKSKSELTQYQLTLLGASEAEKKEAAALQNRIKSMQDANDAAKKHDSVLGSLITRLSALGAAYFGVQAIKNFAYSLIDTAKIMDSYKYSLLAVSENSTQAAETYEYLRKEADRLGLSLTTQEKAFTGFAAAAKQSGLRVEETRSIYSGLMEAMTAIHRSPEEASQALKAFQDMLSKGTLQAEELKKQLGNALPGAMAYMSDATGKSTAELMKMMEQGILPAKEGLIVLSDYLSNKFQISAEGAANSMQGSLNKMENAWYELKAGIVEAMGSNTTGIIKDVTDTIKNMTDQLKDPEVQTEIRNIAEAIKYLTEKALQASSAIAGIVLAIKNFSPLDFAGITKEQEMLTLGAIAAKKGLVDFDEYSKASNHQRNKMVDDAIKKQDEYTNSLIDSAKNSEKASDSATKALKRVSDSQVEVNKETFLGAGVTAAQGKEIQKLTDKIKEQADQAGKSAIEIQADNLRSLGMSEALVKAQIDIMKSTEAKNQAVKDADKASKEAESERERSAEKAISDEKARQGRVDAIINKMKEQIATYKQATEVSAEYQLKQEGASPAEIKLAKDLANTIDALKAKTRAQEAYNKVMDKTASDPIELNREKSIEAVNQAVKDGVVLNVSYAESLAQINKHFDKMDMEKSDKALKEMGNELDKLTKFDGSSFGNTIADGINNAMISMNKLNDTFDNNAKAQALIIKLQKEISTGKGSPEERKEKLEQIDKAESKMIENQISGYRQLFGTASQLFKENSKEREAMHNLEMAFAAVEIAMNLQKTISAAYTAIMVQGTGDPYSAFARIAAMTALAGGIVAAAGGSLSGGGSGSAPTASAQSTQGTGTVMGSPSEKSQSANNALEFMKDIEAKQYNELRDINKGVVDLNNNITNLVTNIIRTGAGTGDMGIALGTSKTEGSLYNRSVLTGGLTLVTDEINKATNGIDTATKNFGAALAPFTLGASSLVSEMVSNIATTLIGGSKKTSIVAQGLKVSTGTIEEMLDGAGVSVQKFADVLTTKKSSWLTGGGTKKYLNEVLAELTPDEESVRIMFTNVFKSVGETMVAISSSLNLGEDNLAKIYAYTFDIGKIDLKGLDSEQINEAISSAINTASDQAVTALFGDLIGKYVQVGEGLLETAIRVVSERAVVLDILEMTGQGFKDSDIPAYSLEITQSLISIAGGIKELQEASVNYYDKFFTDSEKQIRLQGQLTDTMASLGTTLPTSRKELRNFVEGLDLTSVAGQEAYVTILGLTDGFDKFFTVIEDGQALTDANNQAIKKNISDVQIASAQMDMTPFEKSIDDINRSTNAAIETNKALGASESDLAIIRAYGDKQLAATTEAEKKRKEAEEAATQATKDATEARIKSLTDNKMVELLEAEGKSTEALALKRSIELAGMEKSLIPMQERIYELQDESKAMELAKKATKEFTESIIANIQAQEDARKSQEDSVNNSSYELYLELLREEGKISSAQNLERKARLNELNHVGLEDTQKEIWALQDKRKQEEMMVTILELEGKTLEATRLQRKLEFATLTDAEKPLKNRIYALQDEAKQKELGNSISQKTIEIMRLLGNEEGALAVERSLALESMDPALRGFQQAIYDLTDAAKEAAKVKEDAKKLEDEDLARINKNKEINNTINGKTIEIMKLLGNEEGALAAERKFALESMDPALVAYQKAIWKLEDAKKLEDEDLARINKNKEINNSISQKNIEILKLQGKEEQALTLQRQMEIAALDPVLKGLQQTIYDLTDAAKETEEANQRSETNKYLLQRLYALQGKDEEVLRMQRNAEIESLGLSNLPMLKRIYQLEDEKKATEEANAALEKANSERKTLLEKQLSDSEEMLKKSTDKQISYYQELADTANKILDNARGLLDRSFEAEQTRITKQHETLISGLTSRLNEAQTAASDLEGVFNSLSSARKGMFVAGSETAQYKAIQDQLFSVLGQAQGGNFSGISSLSENIGGLGGNNQGMFADEQEYKRDFFKTYNALSELESLTGTQLTDQQQIIKALETQIEESNINNQETLDALQNQYDAVIGVDKSVISFQDAIAQYQKAQYEADGANALLKTQTEILNNQLNVLLGIDTSILSVTDAINNFIAAQIANESFNVSPTVATSTNGISLVTNDSGVIYEAPATILGNNNTKEKEAINEEVVAELKAMRAELARANFELVKNTGDSSKTLKKFDYDGMPETRTA